MRTKIVVDSATPDEAYNLTLAFQRTLSSPKMLPASAERPRWELPPNLTTEPTVTVAGKCMGWQSPALTPDHAVALLAEFDNLQKGRAS